MNTDHNSPDYNKMQELLPDYVLGEINAEDKIFFENNLPFFPDLEKEVNDGLSLFARIEAMDIDGILKQQTKNISVRVIDGLDKQRAKSKFNFVSRVLFPSVGIVAVVIVFFMFNVGGNNLFNTKKHDSTKVNLNQNSDNTSITNNANNVEEKVFDEKTIEKHGNELEKIYNDSPELFNGSTISPSTVFDEIENLNDEQFEEIIKELKNEKINS